MELSVTNMILVFGGKYELQVNGFSYAIFQTYHDNSYSQPSFVFLMNKGAVTWNSSNQKIVPDSNCE